MPTRPESLLRGWLQRQLTDGQNDWLCRALRQMGDDPGDADIAARYEEAPRALGVQALELDGDDLARARAARTGFCPLGWSVADTARVLMLMSLPSPGAKSLARRIDALASTVPSEAMHAVYRGLPLYLRADELIDTAESGLHSEDRTIFEAVAHQNPYPHDHFDERRWNAMILRAVRLDSRLTPVFGLDARANPRLADALRGFAHERWAAGRAVPYEIWRLVGPFAVGDAVGDLERALESPNTAERAAAALALAASPDEAAAHALARQPELSEAIARGELDWRMLAD